MRTRGPGTTRSARTVLLCLLIALPVLLAGCSLRVRSSEAPEQAGQVVRLQVLQQDGATIVIAPVSIGGRGPFPFVLDTGASTSAINADLADQLGLEATGERRTVRGVTSAQTVRIVRVSSWSVGDVGLATGTLGALDFPSSSASSSSASPPGSGGSSVAGLLGSDQLSRFGRVTIDYAAEQLTLMPR